MTRPFRALNAIAVGALVGLAFAGGAVHGLAINTPPEASVVATPSTALEDATVSFTFSTYDPDLAASIANWTLDFGDGSAVASGAGSPPASVPHAYSIGGEYTVLFGVTDNLGDSTTATTEVLVLGRPTATVTATPATGNAPLDVTLTLTAADVDVGGSIANWTLDFGDGSTPRAEAGTPPANVAHTYESDAAFTVVFGVTDADGLSTTATASVSTLNVAPVATLTAGTTVEPAPVEVTLTLAATDADGSIASWSLDFGDGTDPTTGDGEPDAQVSHTYESGGTFTAVLSVTDNDGATTDASAPVVILGGPTAAVAAAPSVGDSPLLVTFTLTASDLEGDIANWTLDFGDGSDPIAESGVPPAVANHTYEADSEFTVVFGVTDGDGFSASATTPVVTNYLPVAAVTATPGAGVIPLSVSFTLTSADVNGSIVAWSLDYGDGSGVSEDSGEPPGSLQHTYTVNGTFTVWFNVTDDKGSVGSATTAVIVGPLATPEAEEEEEDDGEDGGGEGLTADEARAACLEQSYAERHGETPTTSYVCTKEKRLGSSGVYSVWVVTAG